MCKCINSFDPLTNRFAPSYTRVRIAIRGQRRCLDWGLSRKCSAVSSAQLLSQNKVRICIDGVVPLRPTAHAHYLPVPIFITHVARTLEREILFERVIRPGDFFRIGYHFRRSLCESKRSV